MSLPTQYLTSTKNLKGIMTAIQAAKAPKKFTFGFLEGLNYKSSSDRLVIGVLKAIGFLNSNGEPTDRYFKYLDQTQAGRVLAEGIEEAYADLYKVNKDAHELSRPDLKNKLKTLTQGQMSDSVLEKMAMTFTALCELADFSAPPKMEVSGSPELVEPVPVTVESRPREAVSLGGLVYNIQLILPDSRDQAVYDAFFKSLKEHLLK